MFKSTLLVALFSLSAHAAVIEMPNIEGLPHLTVDDSVLNHDYEKRGMVSVPLDYADPASPKIKIFYRYIPSNVAGAPTLVYMNGGPGDASSSMRALHYDYATRPKDAISHLVGTFNVVLVDQRGTQGQSYPLVPWGPELNLEKIGRYFNTDVLALDHAAVTNELIGQGLIDPKHFYSIGNSFGTSIAWSLIRLIAEGKIAHPPTGLVLSVGEVVGQKNFDSWLDARPNQYAVNARVEEWSIAQGKENFSSLMRRAKKHFAELGFDPETASFAYIDMLFGEPADIYKEIEGFLAFQTADEVKTKLLFNLDMTDVHDYLNHVLSLQSLYNGHRAVDLRDAAEAVYPLADWMIDPFKAFVIEETYETDQRDDLYRLYAAGRIPIPAYPTAEQTLEVMKGTRLLWAYGQNDIVSGWRSNIDHLSAYLGADLARASSVIMDSNHGGIRTPQGIEIMRKYFGL